MKQLTENEWKDLLDKASRQYVETHEDVEVRRMFGHYYRAFSAGAIWENDRSKAQAERIAKLEEALKPLAFLFDSVTPDETESDTFVLYKFKSATITISDLRKAKSLLP